MAFGADHAVLLDRLDKALRVTPEPTPELFSKIIASACTRIPILSKSGNAGRIARLVEAGGWTDAAFALIELELPLWKLRRLVYEDGAWFCSLSRQPGLPAALDETADGCHELMPLAILLAFLQARRMAGVSPQAIAAMPAIQATADGMLCCDNFA
jgi:hypothetical protein